MKKLALGIFVLYILALASADTIEPNLYNTPQDLTTAFTIPLDCESCFDVNITSIDGPTGQKAFCDSYPSEIAATVEYNGTIVSGTSYDSVKYFDGYYYALDTFSWRILATKNMSDPESYIFIEVDSSLNHQGTDIPFLVIDEAHKNLYILRKDMAVYYSLISFATAVKNGADIPKIKPANKVDNWALKSYSSLKVAKYFNQNLHVIVNNNVLEVWNTLSTGLTYNPSTFDSEYFSTEGVDIYDITFKGTHAFLLDELNGVQVLDVSNSLKYNLLTNNTISIPDAKFIEITGNTLNVVSQSRKKTTLYEYNMTTTPFSITLNRQVQIRDALRDTHADSNFLFFLTGYENVASRHSIPGTYNSTQLKNSYSSYWPLANIGTFTTVAQGSSSKGVVIQGTKVTVYNFAETKATLRCRAGNYKTGAYVYHVQSMQRNCDGTTDICRVKQAVTITIDPSVPQVSSPETNNTGLIVGIIIAILTIAAIAFAYWYFKRNKTAAPTVRNDVFFRRLSRSPLNQDSSNLYKVTMDIERSGVRADGHADDDHKLGADRKKSDDFVLGPQRSDDAEESPKRAAIIRGKTFSELEKPKLSLPKTNTMSNIEGGHKNYDGEI